MRIGIKILFCRKGEWICLMNLQRYLQKWGDQELTCSCTECYWNMYFPNRSNSKECVSESLAAFKMTPNSTECKGYWNYTEACGHPKR